MALYVDNLERGCYDIPLVIKNWDADRIALFAGGTPTINILQDTIGEDSRISIIPLENRIKTPSDIPRAFNASVHFCYDRLNADAVVLAAADIYITKEGMQHIRSVYEQHMTMTMIYEHVQLYSYMQVALPSVVLSKRDNQIYYGERSGDSVLVDTKRADHIHHHYDPKCLRDVGYLTIANYVAKMRSHNNIWPDQYKVDVVRLFEKDVIEGLRFAYKAISRTYRISPISPEPYKELFDYYNCYDEYKMCVGIMKSV